MLTRRNLIGAAAALSLAPATGFAISPDDPQARIGGYFLSQYGLVTGTLATVDLISAFGAVAGLFAQMQARAELQSGAWKIEEDPMVEVQGKDGQTFWFGNAINVALFGARHEGLTAECGAGPEGFGLWTYVAAAAHDQDIEKEVDLGEISQHNAGLVGSSDYGAPRPVDGFLPSQNTVAAAKMHFPALKAEMNRLGVKDNQYIYLFGATAQQTMPFIAGERDFIASPKLPPVPAIRLFMEAAIATSKVNLASVDTS